MHCLFSTFIIRLQSTSSFSLLFLSDIYIRILTHAHGASDAHSHTHTHRAERCSHNLHTHPCHTHTYIVVEFSTRQNRTEKKRKENTTASYHNMHTITYTYRCARVRIFKETSSLPRALARSLSESVCMYVLRVVHRCTRASYPAFSAGGVVQCTRVPRRATLISPLSRISYAKACSSAYIHTSHHITSHSS